MANEHSYLLGGELKRSDDASYLFKYIILIQIIIYLEAGAVPALLSTLTEIFHLSFMLQGALGGIMYIFISLACPLASYCFYTFPVREVIGTMLLINGIATLAMGLTPQGWAYFLIGARSVIGATQAFIMVFSPVWVDEYSPPNRRTSWLSYLQASVPCGIMLGRYIYLFM